jgi:rfaE bifunctional protein nucleotidyltransferase chain/domain
MSDGHPQSGDDLEALRRRCESWRSQGEKLVTTNGCFDILHAGHIHMLMAARELGDRLIVGLNSDASVGRLKGPDRPVVPEDQRRATLAALPFVDHVQIFAEDTPDEVLRAVRPDVHAKGGDYVASELPEYDLIAGLGGELVIVPEVPGLHSSSMLAAYRQRTES